MKRRRGRLVEKAVSLEMHFNARHFFYASLISLDPSRDDIECNALFLFRVYDWLVVFSRITDFIRGRFRVLKSIINHQLICFSPLIHRCIIVPALYHLQS